MPDEDHDDAEFRIFDLSISVPVAETACVDAAQDLGAHFRPTILTLSPPNKSLISKRRTQAVVLPLQLATDDGTQVSVRVHEDEQPADDGPGTTTFDLDHYQSLIEPKLGLRSTASGAPRPPDAP